MTTEKRQRRFLKMPPNQTSFQVVRQTMAVRLAPLVPVALQLLSLLIFVAALAPGRLSAEPLTQIRPFLEQHCLRCHGPDKQSGKFRLDNAPLNVADAGFGKPWAMVLERITAGEMPPEEEPQPSSEEIARVVEAISTELRESEILQQTTAAGVVFYKLTREEYARTLFDLLGVTYVPTDPGGLPEDPNWHGFERIGSVVSLSPAHIEKYLALNEKSLNEAIPSGPPPEGFHERWNWQRLRAAGRVDDPARVDKARVEVPPNNNTTSYPGANYPLPIRTEGDYRVRISASGIRPPGGSAPHLRLYCSSLDRTLHEQDVEAPEEKPTVIEFRTHLPAGDHSVMAFNALPGPSPYESFAGYSNVHVFFSLKEGRAPFQQKLTDDDGVPLFPILIVDYIEWEGPLRDPAVTEQILGTGPKDASQARAIIAKFASRAFRRPVRDEEITRLVKLFEAASAAGAPFEQALKNTLLAVLCSKDFLYLVEGSADSSPAATVNDWELASRLSYFLWSTMPDAELFDLAEKGQLHERATLRLQVARMLQDPKAEVFAEDFARQWLQLRNVGKFPPDKKLYPEYDEQLEKSMVRESTSFFRQVLAENLGVGEFVNSNWTMLNTPLAQHYGIPGVTDIAMQKVSLKPDDHRGGLLTQAAVLSQTSDGTRHRPVHRGKWILESVFGASPPPPPPNVGDIPVTPATEPKATLRMKLEAHRSNAVCNSCHRRIDPLGLAFENYDAIGRWRTQETVRDGVGENPPVDATGVLPDGRTFADAAELKGLLQGDLDKIAAAFTEKLATYALRRGMNHGDRAALSAIAAQTKGDGYRVRALLEALVLSDLFQQH